MLDKKIKNVTHRWTNHLLSVGCSSKFISRFVARMVTRRGPMGKGRYACTCNNWGPRWLEYSQDGCCPGCFAWALDHHQEMKVNGVAPVTMAIIDQSASWGFNILKIRQLRAKRVLAGCVDC